MRKLTGFLAGAVLAASAATANAVVVLDFEGIGATYPFMNTVEILDFYNGGTSAAGTSGVNHGVSFDNASALCLNTATDSCSNTSHGGLAPASATGAMILTQDGEAVLDFAAGFDTALSFLYTQPYDVGFPSAVYVYEGLGGSGNLLGFLDLDLTASACAPEYSATFCPFEVASLGFSGIARSVVFEGTANWMVFDNVTLGSATPGNGGSVAPGIPEPTTWAMLLMGFGLVGMTARRRRITFIRA